MCTSQQIVCVDRLCEQCFEDILNAFYPRNYHKPFASGVHVSNLSDVTLGKLFNLLLTIKLGICRTNTSSICFWGMIITKRIDHRLEL